MKKAVVFDLGGTLMKFKGMPPVWIDYYKTAFNNVNKKYNLGLQKCDIEKSVEIMSAFNPRVNYREKEILSEEIFDKATDHWNSDIKIENIINTFFDGIELNTVIYDYSFNLINQYRDNGYRVACLTDLPCGMPDDMFKNKIKPLVDRFDLYVSSQSCGYRKPNAFGLQYIADCFDMSVNELLFIGDEEKDRLTAVNAGCNFMFIGEIRKNIADIF